MREVIPKRLLIALCAVGAMLLLAPVASASYPGRAGALVYLHFSTTYDPLGGTATYDWLLSELRAPGAGSRRIYECAATDAGPAPGVCPDVGVGFSPSGDQLTFAGGEFDAGGSSTPAGFANCFSSGCGTDELFVADLNGHAAPLQLPLFDAEHPAFLPDGKTIVFAGKRRSKSRTQLYLVGSDGSGLKQITTAGGTNPAPCADGRIIYNRGAQLYVLSTNRRASRHLTNGSLADCSPNSRTAVFLRAGTLYTVRLNGTGLRRLSQPRVVTGRPAFSPAGDRIAYIGCTARGCSGPGGSLNQPNAGCQDTDYVLTTIDLHGTVLARRTLGSSGCDSDGFFNGDTFGQVAWQPLPKP